MDVRIALLVLAGCGRLDFDGEPSSLVAYYTMDDDAAGGLVADRSGNGFDATCSSCPVRATGHRGLAYNFDGVADLLTVIDTGQFRLDQGFTIMAWLNPSDLGMAAHTAISKPLAAGPGASAELALFGTDSWFCTTPASEDCLMTGVALTPSTWTHVAMIWDGSAKRIYVNGIEIGQAPSTTTFDSSPLVIGADREDGVFRYHFAGLIDEVRIFSRAQATDEVVALAGS